MMSKSQVLCLQMLTIVLASMLMIIGPIESISHDEIERTCATQLKSISDIEQFQEFANELRKLDAQHHVESTAVKSKSLNRCIEQKEAINVLRIVIRGAAKRDVCHPSHIDDLIDYHNRYVKDDSTLIISRFFRRYALAVSMTCAGNFYANLLEAERKMGSQQATNFDESLGVDKSKWTIKKNNEEIPNRIIEDLKRASESVERPEQLVLIDQLLSRLKLQISAQFPANQRSTIERLIKQCRRLSTYYETAIKSITKLANIGFSWSFDTIKQNGINLEDIDRKQWLRKWLDIVQRCDLVLNVRVESWRSTNVIIALIDESRSFSGAITNTISRNEAVRFERNVDQFATNLALLSVNKVNGAELGRKSQIVFKIFQKITNKLNEFSSRLAKTNLSSRQVTQSEPSAISVPKSLEKNQRWWESLRDDARGFKSIAGYVLAKTLMIFGAVINYTKYLLVNQFVLTAEPATAQDLDLKRI